MNRTPIERHQTALSRPVLSRPLRLAIEDGLVTAETEVFDYGCGRGDDLRHLGERGIQCRGWDPVYRPGEQRSDSDVVNLGYVVNVIEDVGERELALQHAWHLARRLLVVASRLEMESDADAGIAYADGYLTRRRTFQKFFAQQELREWIDQTLGVLSVAAGPGVFYVFRDPGLRESFLASRYRRHSAAPRIRQSDALYQQHRELLEPLIHFVSLRGRLPEQWELPEAPPICAALGSLRRAFGIIQRVTGTEQWEQVKEERSQDLLIYLALARFQVRPRFSTLPPDLQLDVRAFFSNYRHSCAVADELLFSAGRPERIDAACQVSPVGKLTPGSLYVHKSAVTLLPPLLRIYEGCARAYIGAVEGANIVKLSRTKAQVSYLSYPMFERDAHPSLAASLIVPLQTFRVRYLEYRDSANPPILHRKEAFVSSEHPLRARFERLTQEEERNGLYRETRDIGTREAWRARLAECGLELRGHRIVKVKTKPVPTATQPPVAEDS